MASPCSSVIGPPAAPAGKPATTVNTNTPAEMKFDDCFMVFSFTKRSRLLNAGTNVSRHRVPAVFRVSESLLLVWSYGLVSVNGNVLVTSPQYEEMLTVVLAPTGTVEIEKFAWVCPGGIASQKGTWTNCGLLEDRETAYPLNGAG